MTGNNCCNSDTLIKIFMLLWIYLRKTKKESVTISNKKCDWCNKLISLVDDKFITKMHLIQPSFT